MNKKSFLEGAGGAILERTDYALNQIFDNIMDPNTRATAKRKLTLIIEFKADDARQQIAYSVVAKPTLEPTAPLTGAYAVQEDSRGNAIMVEMTPQIAGQLSTDGDEQPEPNVIELRRA